MGENFRKFKNLVQKHFEEFNKVQNLQISYQVHNNLKLIKLIYIRKLLALKYFIIFLNSAFFFT